MPPRKRARADQASGQQAGEEEEDDEVSLLRDRLAKVMETSVEAVRKRAEEEGDRLLADATEAAIRVMTDATEAAKKAAKRVMTEATEAAAKLIADEFNTAQEERKALEEEKVSMEKAHDFQKNKIILNVGGQRFETSRQTLASVPDTYLASMFSGRFELTPDVADGSYFIDRNPKHFNLVLDYLRDSGSSNTANAIASTMEEQQVRELKTELAFYGLLDRMLPYYELDQIGRDLLRRACSSGTADTIKRDIQTAVAQARLLIFTIGSTTPFLNEKYQDLRFVINERVVNGSPVWAAVDGQSFMYRGTLSVGKVTTIGTEEQCAKGTAAEGFIANDKIFKHVVAPADLPSDHWWSGPSATLQSLYASAVESPPLGGTAARIPEMRITAVHGLDDEDPAMEAALRQLAALQ